MWVCLTQDHSVTSDTTVIVHTTGRYVGMFDTRSFGDK